MRNLALWILSIYSTVLFSTCRIQRNVENSSSCEKGSFSQLTINEEDINVSIQIYSCHKVEMDTVEFIIYILNNSETDTNLTSMFIPLIHNKLNCTGFDTISFMYPKPGGHPYYGYNPINFSVQWPSPNENLLKPQQRKMFLARLGVGQLCTLEYKVLSYTSRTGYSLFVSRSANGRSMFALVPIIN